jgi:molybdopterin-containing oxidoreductase family iron-sulfur binding subunit
MIPLPLTTDEPPPRFWRTPEERDNDPAFLALVEREFPEQAGLLSDPVSRRQFLALMGASLALAGAGGCGRTAPETIVPPVRPAVGTIPGIPNYFATAMPMPGGATGLLVKSVEGRPVKVEGNPQHPASLGATDAFAQASILGLYDPDRAQSLTHLGRIVGWNDALAALEKMMAPLAARNGAGFALLTGSINSPTLAAQLMELATSVLPQMKWYHHEPTLSPSSGQATRLAFGEPLKFLYRVGEADVIVAIDCDLLGSVPNHLRYAREFAARRTAETPDDARRMSRLYAVETTPSPTGFAADHRLPLRPVEIEAFTSALADRLGVAPWSGTVAPSAARLVDAVAMDLQGHAGRSLVVAGPYQSARVHGLVHAINDRLGNFGKTVVAISSMDQADDDLPDLCRDIEAGRVQTLLILSSNPVYTAPADWDFAAALQKVPLRIRLGLYDDETAALCHWTIPEAHFLESWSDAAAPDGTATIIQPLIAPLYDGKSAHEVVAAFRNMAQRAAKSELPNWREGRGREIVRDHWRRWHAEHKVAQPFEAFWRQSLHDGVVPGSAAEPRSPTLRNDWTERLPAPATASGPFDILIRPDPCVFDGRFANNGWLQELPKPLTKLTWDNAAIVSPKTAADLGIEPYPGPHGGGHGELITKTVMLTVGGRSVEAPVFVLPGHADDAVTVHLGFGRSAAGRVGNTVGFNAFSLRSSDRPWTAGARMERCGRAFTLACTQYHHLMLGRDIVRATTVAGFLHDPSVTPKHGHGAAGHNPAVEGLPAELFTNQQTGGPYQWAMSINLGACTGCGSCVVACQAENNIPVVGKDQVTRGREMHWLRIDRYFEGDPANPTAYHQPLPCMHCENAPCEVVCPVAATTHSPDGLNEMTYNRCVGTRYCANNCPYKVRRFNFLEYTSYADKSLALGRNPDVSVRVRGVMEKCTYCVQRIRGAEIDARAQGRTIRDGEVVTACQAACPTEAIVFGNIRDPGSRVSKLKALPRDYGLLTELNTKPRTTYLAAVRNPNPEVG